MKKNILFYLSIFFWPRVNVVAFIFSRNTDFVQMAWIAFVLVWLNIFVGVFAHQKQPQIYILYYFASLLILSLSLLNIFWLSTRIL